MRGSWISGTCCKHGPRSGVAWHCEKRRYGTKKGLNVERTGAVALGLCHSACFQNAMARLAAREYRDGLDVLGVASAQAAGIYTVCYRGASEGQPVSGADAYLADFRSLSW